VVREDRGEDRPCRSRDVGVAHLLNTPDWFSSSGERRGKEERRERRGGEPNNGLAEVGQQHRGETRTGRGGERVLCSVETAFES
jgi:hypothetical protein